MERFLQQLIILFFVMPLCLLPMDSAYKLIVEKTIPFKECHSVVFLKKNVIALSSKYAKSMVFDWKKNEEIDHPLLKYDLFSMKADRWNKNILPCQPNRSIVEGYDIQLQQPWTVSAQKISLLIGFSDQEQDFLIIQDHFYDPKNTEVHLVNCKTGLQISQESLSTALRKCEGARLRYYNSNTRKAMYTVSGSTLYIQDLSDRNIPVESFVTKVDNSLGQIFSSLDNTFAIYLVARIVYFIDLLGKKNPFLLSDHKDRRYAGVMIHPNSKYIFTMSCVLDSLIQIWDTKGICIFEQGSPTPEEDDAAERARNYSSCWDAFSLSACRKYLAVAFPTQCVIYRLPFHIMYGSDYRDVFSRKLLLLKNCYNSAIPRDIVWLILKKLMYVSRW